MSKTRLLDEEIQFQQYLIRAAKRTIKTFDDQLEVLVAKREAAQAEIMALNTSLVEAPITIKRAQAKLDKLSVVKRNNELRGISSISTSSELKRKAERYKKLQAKMAEMRASLPPEMLAQLESELEKGEREKDEYNGPRNQKGIEI